MAFEEEGNVKVYKVVLTNDVADIPEKVFGIDVKIHIPNMLI